MAVPSSRTDSWPDRVRKWSAGKSATGHNAKSVTSEVSNTASMISTPPVSLVRWCGRLDIFDRGRFLTSVERSRLTLYQVSKADLRAFADLDWSAAVPAVDGLAAS